MWKHFPTFALNKITLDNKQQEFLIIGYQNSAPIQKWILKSTFPYPYPICESSKIHQFISFSWVKKLIETVSLSLGVSLIVSKTRSNVNRITVIFISILLRFNDRTRQFTLVYYSNTIQMKTIQVHNPFNADKW